MAKPTPNASEIQAEIDQLEESLLLLRDALTNVRAVRDEPNADGFRAMQRSLMRLTREANQVALLLFGRIEKAERDVEIAKLSGRG